MDTKCEICDEPSVVQVTDLSSTPVHIANFCREHVPSEYAKTLKRETARIWSVPENRNSITEFVSNDLKIQPEQARAVKYRMNEQR
jgi:hypothetical protein